MLTADTAIACGDDKSTPQPVQCYSVYAESEREALQFKWIESERAGYDLGEEALKRWVKQYWTGYLRARLIEHLEGTRYWSELDLNDFGLLKREFGDDRLLLETIVDRLRAGQENLHIICWAEDFGIPMCRVRRILESININARRLIHHLDPDLC